MFLIIKLGRTQNDSQHQTGVAPLGHYITSHGPSMARDVNKDLTPKDQDKDKDLTPKDQEKDKDLTPRTRTRT